MRKLVLVAIVAVLCSGLIAQNAGASGWKREPHAVTLWWVIFNNPENCTFDPAGIARCGSVDVFGAAFLASVANGTPDPTLIAPNVDAGLAVIYATGGKTNRNGRVRLAASITRSAAGPMDFGGPSVVDPMGLGRALDNPEAEIHLVVRDHGDVVREGLLAQITNFLEPYCSDPNLLFFSGDNICADTHFAVFAGGESGEKDVFAFGETPQRVNRATAHLIRNGDMIQAFVDTRIDTRRD